MPPQQNQGQKALISIVNVVIFVIVCVILAFVRVGLKKITTALPAAGFQQGSPPFMSTTPDAGLSGIYATQDMINQGMTNTMNLTFYSNSTFQLHYGGMYKDESGTYKLNGNSLVFDPGDPVYNQSNNPMTNGFVQSMTGTVSDDRSTINYAGGTWIKVR